MGSVFLKVQLPCLFEVRYPEQHVAVLIRAVRPSQKVPLKAWLPAVPGLGKFQLQQHPVPVADHTVTHTAEEPQQQLCTIHHLLRLPVQEKIRKRFPSPGLRRMLPPKLGKAVVCRHK